MPASNVRRVRSEGFSKNITICLPARAPRKSAGRCLSMEVRLNSERISAGARSWTETRSRGATGSGSRFGGGSSSSFVVITIAVEIVASSMVPWCPSHFCFVIISSESFLSISQSVTTFPECAEPAPAPSSCRWRSPARCRRRQCVPTTSGQCEASSAAATGCALPTVVFTTSRFCACRISTTNWRARCITEGSTLSAPTSSRRRDGSRPALDQLQFVDVAGQCRLTHLEALAFQALLQGVLAFDRTVVEQVENRFMAGCFGHE